MALRPQAARSSKQRTSKVRRQRRASKSKYQPLLESLEPRMLLTGSWQVISSTNPAGGPPSGVETMMMLSDGRVLQAGTAIQPFAPTSSNWYPLSPDANGRYTTGTYGAVSTMNTPRLYFPSVVLPDGRIFAIGGEYGNPVGFVNSPEIFDPQTNIWTPVAPMPSPLTQIANAPNVPPLSPTSQFGDDPIEVLPNGDILAGWFGGGNTFVYNVASDTWRPTTGAKLHASNFSFNVTGSIQTDASDEESWIKLPDGSILSYDIFGSLTANKFLAQRFVPGQDSWVDASNLDTNNPPQILTGAGQGFELGPGFLLPDGRVILFGANGHSAYYNTKTDTWSAGPDLPFINSNGVLIQSGASDVPGAVLPNGHVLIALAPVAPIFAPPARIFEFDPSNNSFTDVSPPGALAPGLGSFLAEMLVLPTGQILLTNQLGNNGIAGGGSLIYTPDGSPLDAWRPTIQSLTDNGDGTLTLMGTQLNGLNEGAAYGDDALMASNYPLVRITNNTTGIVTYARTFNWSSTGVQTGGQIVSTKLTLPNGLTLTDLANSSVVVVANGIPSAPYQFFPVKPQTVSGTVFSDLNVDGIRQAGEPGISHITVYLDLNGDGKVGGLEPACVTDNFGRWSFSNVAPGNYVVREVASPGILAPAVQTTPGTGATIPLAFTISVFDRAVKLDSFSGKLLDFGHIAAYDFGDAPDGQVLPNGVVAHYGTVLADDGARAGILPGFGLGAQIDLEQDGQPTIGATGDDVVDATTTPPKIDDEDGVTFGPMTPGFPTTITVNVSTGGYTPGKLQGWIDWNQNGKFDTGEQIVTNASMGAGVHAVTINVPSTAKIGPTYARFRYGYETNLGPTGLSLAGEVEDYQVTVLPAIPIANPDTFPLAGQGLIRPTSTNVHLDVLANDVGTVFGSPKIDPNSITQQDNFGSTFTVQPDLALGRQVIVYNPGPGVQGGVPERFTYKVYTRTDQFGNPIDDSNAAQDVINIAFADNIAIDDTFTYSPATAGGGVTKTQIPVMQNDISSHAPEINGGTARVIAVDVRTAADQDKINNPNGTPTPPAAQTSVMVTTGSGPATLQIDGQHPSTLDFFSPAGFTGTLIFKYEIDDDDPDTAPSTRYVTIQVVDPSVAAGTTGDAAALMARQADPSTTDNSLLAAGYLAELDVSVLPSLADGSLDPTLNPVNMVHAGDTFYLRVQSHDLRQGGNTSAVGVPPNATPANRGVEAAYLDLLLNPGFLNNLSIRSYASPQPDNPGNLLSAVIFGPEYGSFHTGQNGVAGAPAAPEFNEIGATVSQGGGQPEENTLFPDVFYVRMLANQATPAGQSITFTGDPADATPASDVVIPTEDQTTPGNQSILVLNDEQVYLGQTTLTILAEGEGEFVNFANPVDVNQDGTVAPNDLMIVINAINATGARTLIGATPTPHQMFDVNMDNALSPSDIVKLITFLNAYGSTGGSATVNNGGAAGEGESSPADATASTDLALLSTSSPTSSSSTSTTSSTLILAPSTTSSSTTAATTSTSSSTSTTSQTTTSSSSDSVDAASVDELFAVLSAAKRNSSGLFG